MIGILVISDLNFTISSLSNLDHTINPNPNYMLEAAITSGENQSILTALDVTEARSVD